MKKAATLEESRVAAFSRRLNFLAPAFQALAEEWLTVILKKEVENTTYIVDSCPVILAKGPRSGYAKVAGELCAKSYNSSRKEWYYGVKLHAFVARKPGRLLENQAGCSKTRPASSTDGTVLVWCGCS